MFHRIVILKNQRKFSEKDWWCCNILPTKTLHNYCFYGNNHSEKLLVRVLTSFGFNVFFQKKFDIFGQYLVPSRTKNVSFYSLVLGQHPLIAFQHKVFIKVFQCIWKSLETFLIRNYFYSNAKHYKQDKKNEDKLWSHMRFLNWKY